MQRIKSVNAELAQGRTKELLAQVRQQFGVVPNAVKLMANSPAVLESFLAFSQAMEHASIGDKLHNQVKLATSESNSCAYCTSILSATAPAAGLTSGDILEGRTATAEDPRTDAALRFANAVLENRGMVSDDQLRAVRETGFNDAEIVEIVTSVVQGCFTNFLNNLADTDLDIPRAEPVHACSTEAACGCSP